MGHDGGGFFLKNGVLSLPQLKFVGSANDFVSSETLNSKLCEEGRRRKDDMDRIYRLDYIWSKKRESRPKMSGIY